MVTAVMAANAPATKPSAVESLTGAAAVPVAGELDVMAVVLLLAPYAAVVRDQVSFLFTLCRCQEDADKKPPLVSLNR